MLGDATRGPPLPPGLEICREMRGSGDGGDHHREFKATVAAMRRAYFSAASSASPFHGVVRDAVAARCSAQLPGHSIGAVAPLRRTWGARPPLGVTKLRIDGGIIPLRTFLSQSSGLRAVQKD